MPSLGLPDAERAAEGQQVLRALRSPWPPKMSSVMPARSIRPNGSVKSGSAGAPLTGPLNGNPASLLPPAATNAMYSATSERSSLCGLYKSGVLSFEFSSVAYPVVPGKKTPMPPTSADFPSTVLVERDATGQGRDPARLGRRQDPGDLSVRLGATRFAAGGDVLRRDVEPRPGGRAEAVAVGALDVEQVDLGREHDARREMPLDRHRRDEPRPVQRRVTVGIGDVGVGRRPRAG